MILLIDNYDSFSYNLVQLIGSIVNEKENKIRVVRNDELSVEEVLELKPSHIILSPGPGKPSDAGICEELILAVQGNIPLLGVCLGHQGICEAYHATVSYAKVLMHGKQSKVKIDQSAPIFLGLEEVLSVARYHSLAVLGNTLPDFLKVIAKDFDGEIMAVKHEKYDVYGLQFHPESVLTPMGEHIMRNFLKINKGESL